MANWSWRWQTVDGKSVHLPRVARGHGCGPLGTGRRMLKFMKKPGWQRWDCPLADILLLRDRSHHGWQCDWWQSASLCTWVVQAPEQHTSSLIPTSNLMEILSRQSASAQMDSVEDGAKRSCSAGGASRKCNYWHLSRSCTDRRRANF